MDNGGKAERLDVAIVGCGPVGGVLATLLGLRGHRVAVIERHESPYPLPRAVHFDHETARILQACGLGGRLAEISEPGSEYEWRNASGQVLLRFGRAVGPSGWPDSNMFWQPGLERLIEAAAADQPTVEVRRGLRLVDLDDTGDEVTLTVQPDAAGPSERVRARYVVGCDGANSTVRDLIGVAVTDLGFFYDWLIVDVAMHEPRVFDPLNLQICDPSRPTTVVSGGPGRRRWEFMRLPGEAIEELDDATRAWELLQPWNVTPSNATLERHAVYRFQARWADTWRKGNVLLAGDAAHQMPPFAGQGMCSGLRDAVNLAWKLDLVLADRAPATLLDAYASERNDNVRAVIEFSMELGKVICISDPEAAAERDAAMADGAAHSGAQSPPPLPGVTNGVLRADDPLAGVLFVQGRVDGAGRAERFDDLMGAGWRLVTMDPDAAAGIPADTQGWFAGCGGAVVALTPEQDVDRTYAEWFDRHSVAAVLQRPDFHLFGAASTAGDSGALLEDLRAALERPLVPTGPTSDGGTP